LPSGERVHYRGLVARRAYGTGSLYLRGGAWYGRWRTPDGRRQARRIGAARTNASRTGLTKKEAEQLLREILLTAALSSGDPTDQTTVAQLGRALLAALTDAGRKRSHIESVRYHLSKHIEPMLGDIEARDVDERDVQRLVDRLHRDRKAPKTIRNVIGTLHSVLGLAVERRLLPSNPCDMAKLPDVPRDETIHFLTQAELERVLAAPPPPHAAQAERDWWPVVRLLVLTAAMTGMRLGELRALRWDDLDMAAMKVRVRQSYVRGEYGTPKSRRSVRAIPLASRLVAELEEHHKHTVWNQDHDLVLAHPHTGRPLDRVRLLAHFKAALQRADTRPVRLHDLRHTFATTIAASGQVSLRTLQEWMGHRDLKTTQIYADYLPGEREAELIDAAFGGQLVANSFNTARSDPPETPVNTDDLRGPT
jgi:integrase